MADLRDQYCVRLGPTPDRKGSGYVMWRLSRAEGKRVLRELHNRLRKGGHATIAVRSDVCSW